MSYLVQEGAKIHPPGEQFRQLLARPEILRLPGAQNGLAALQAKAAGFSAVYLSGAAMSASMGLPDLGVLNKDDICFFIRQIYRASGLPILVDGDTGFGGILNVIDMVRSFEEAGAAAVQIEDQSLPKKCGHLNDKNLVSPEEMAAKVAAAARARTHLQIVARTDAAASEGIDGAIARARLYVEAGADAIFPEALTTRDMFEKFAASIDVPLLANMTEFGKTPYMPATDFEAMGYKMVIWPVSSLRVANKAQEALYNHLAENGETHSLLGTMQTRAELYDLIGYSDHEALDATLQKTIMTEAMGHAARKDGTKG
ncbi:MAG: methylisocitrate lyase [Rhodobiaceae bacterium]|nr:methylisocitrate lyase [Rhodobiaceae bacterium]MCC0054591.1 methylisocitrate lyase [Rhodobiaceae bacterium]